MLLLPSGNPITPIVDIGMSWSWLWNSSEPNDPLETPETEEFDPVEPELDG